MKIIGVAGDRFILDAHKDEVAQIMGERTAYNYDYDHPTKRIGLAFEIPISKIFVDANETLAAYKSIQKDLESTKVRIAKLLALMKPAEREEGNGPDKK